MRVDGYFSRRRHYAPSRHVRSWNRTDQLNVVKTPEFQAADTQRSKEDAHGYHHASHNCPCHSVAWRRLVRPWTLVLDVADFKLARRCNAAASFPDVITCFGLGANFYPKAAYMSEVEHWRELPKGRVEFMRRLRTAD
jgi:hypothetical protein